MKTIKVKHWSEIPKNFTGIIEYQDGTKKWYKEGYYHREDGPAVEYANGTKEWWFEGNCHRLDGPAIEWANGSKFWYKEGKRHREDGPACEWLDGTKSWYKEGKYHRLDGPAVEYSDGEKYWRIENQEYPKINLEDYLILDYSEGKYGLIWYKLLDKDKIIEYPDIPGLIVK